MATSESTLDLGTAVSSLTLVRDGDGQVQHIAMRVPIGDGRHLTLKFRIPDAQALLAAMSELVDEAFRHLREPVTITGQREPNT
jgi:hypothetical protein